MTMGNLKEIVEFGVTLVYQSSRIGGQTNDVVKLQQGEVKLLSTTVKHSLGNCCSSPTKQEKHRAPTSDIAKITNCGGPLTTSHMSNLKEIADSQRSCDNP